MKPGESDRGVRGQVDQRPYHGYLKTRIKGTGRLTQQMIHSVSESCKRKERGSPISAKQGCRRRQQLFDPELTNLGPFESPIGRGLPVWIEEACYPTKHDPSG